MSVGSAFDAHVKAYYHTHLFGKGTNPEFEFDTIFEAQVEPHNRDWARYAGQYAFDAYKTSGACVDLLMELQKAKSEPRFEFTLQETLFRGHEDCPDGVPVLGKPDVYFINTEGCPIVLDWKVNGFCSKYNKSPAKGYVKVRDGWQGSPSRGAGACHKDALVVKTNGIKINCGITMDEVDKKWATQLTTYAWLMGARVGEQFICAIDQLCCKPDGSKEETIPANGTTGAYILEVQQPKVRVAEHRCTVSDTYQKDVRKKFVHLWNVIQDGTHIFRHMELADSQERCTSLDNVYKAFESDPNAMAPGAEELFRDLMGR